MARINSEDLFYSFSNYKNWYIPENIVDAIKEINWEFKEGSYCDRVLVTIESNNTDIVEKYRKDLNSSDFYNRCGLAIQFFTRHIRFEDLDADFIEKNNIQKYHLDLINKLYFDEGRYQDWFDDELAPGNSTIISTADKRPFGNSSIESDIFTIIDPIRARGDIDPYENENIREKCWIIYDEMLEILIQLLNKFPMSFRNFERISKEKVYPDYQKKYFSHNWIPSLSEFRDIKINQILDENI
jgi:hypothetical protein